jgi:N-methylhydantoinase A/oxoprolinase/acetone carboxylase beta subunit
VVDVLASSGIPFADIQFITHGSTVATNALVQQQGAPVGLLVTRGFRDIPETRRLWREHLFGNFWDRPPALTRRKLRREVRERIDRDGRVLTPLDEDDVRREVCFLRDQGVASIAICFLFSFLNPEHERRAEAIAREVYPDVFVTLSSDVNPEIKEYERMSTTLVAASLMPILDRYLATLEQRLREEGIVAPIHIMKSNAGIMSASAARRKPAEVIKSGPAGGIAASRFYGALLGEPNLITIDIGGTTADVGLVRDGEATVVRSGLGYPGAGADGRHQVDRRRRRLDCLARPGRRPARRAAERWRGSRTCLLRTRWHAADRHRRGDHRRLA